MIETLKRDTEGVRIESSWKHKLEGEFSKTYFQQLTAFVRKEYEEGICFPPGGLIFNAFNHCQFNDLKVVIIGQDPYHGPGQANGLCFSVNDGVKFPPSLRNIFKEVESDLGHPYPVSGNLERWADQGVLLLNATLTVRAHQAGSHQKKGWEEFTDAVIRCINDEKENVVFMLWGAFAKRKGEIVNPQKHLVLSSAHPSPFSADRGFFGNKHFSKANEYLRARGKSIIDWS